jgi:hypothetical protein
MMAADAIEIAELAMLGDLAYARRRKGAAEGLRIPVSMLDKHVRQAARAATR